MALDVTPRDVCSLALQDAGIVGENQTPTAYQMNRAFTRLNWLLMQWRVKRWLVYRLRTQGLTSTGAESYTVGPGGQYDIAVRPDRLEAAFFRQLTLPAAQQVDYPLELIQAREDYNRIALKGLTSFPAYVWYDNALPLGELRPWPIPQASLYAVYITVKEPVEEFADLADVMNSRFPGEYFKALELNLAVELRESYSLAPKPVLVQLAKAATNVLRGSNAQIPRLQVPSELVRPGIYNPYSDQIR